MEQHLQEQTLKIHRYEVKLRDAIIAYKKIQTENESLRERLQTALNSESCLQTKLEEQTKMLEEQRSKNLELSERIANLVIEKEKRDTEEISSLKQRVSQLSKNLETEQDISKNLKVALSEANEQRESSTLHFETRISDIISTLKAYQEIHLKDTETINQLRSERKVRQCKDFPRSPINATNLADFFSTLTDRKCNDAEVYGIGDLFDLMRQIWQTIISVSSLQQRAIEKELIQHLDLKSLVPLELVDACEKEKTDMRQELEATKLRLMPLQDGKNKCASFLTSSKESHSCDGSNEMPDKHRLQLQLREAQENIKLLRKQNLTTLLELESLRKSVLSGVAATEEEVAGRLADAEARHVGQLVRLESEANRYREQMLSLLAEKDEEITELRTALFVNHGVDSTATLSYRSTPSGIAYPLSLHSPSIVGSEDGEPDTSTLSAPLAFDESFASHCGLVHCAERHGRLLIELRRLRNCKRELEKHVEGLEMRLRTERRAMIVGDKTARESTSIPFTSESQRGDVNLVYVKNIVFNLLSSFKSSPLSSRLAVVKALAMALHFTPEEESALIGGIII